MSFWEGKRAGYTLLELLISISIMALLTIIFIPDIDRTLSRNNISSDAELISSQIESTRLLAGSTQQFDAINNNSQYGFYAAEFPATGSRSQFYIVRIDADNSGNFSQSSSNGSCPLSAIIPTPSSNCIVSTVSLSAGDSLTNTTDQLVIFQAPLEKLVGYDSATGSLAPVYPALDTTIGLRLNSFNKSATLVVDGTTGKVITTYN